MTCQHCGDEIDVDGFEAHCPLLSEQVRRSSGMATQGPDTVAQLCEAVALPGQLFVVIPKSS